MTESHRECDTPSHSDSGCSTDCRPHADTDSDPDTQYSLGLALGIMIMIVIVTLCITLWASVNNYINNLYYP